MSEVKHQCCGQVWGRYSFRPGECSKAGKVERDGNWYCGMHDPVAIQAKADKRNDARKAKWDAEKAVHEAAATKRKETQRRADCFDELVEALQKFLDYEKAMDSRDDVSGMLIYAEFSSMAREALTKAQGEAS